jgi:Sec-independent protein translocase protein TatA
MEHGIFGWLFIIVALVFIFGGSKKLEDLGRGFGGFMREFSKAKKESEEQAAKTIEEPKPSKTEEPPKS